jgi:YfiH family protein
MALGDDPAAVTENYTRITGILGTERERMVFSRQVHGDIVRIVGKADCFQDIASPFEEGDALVTIEPDVTLAVFTADCIPILLWDAYTGAVSAIHAGWRSTVLDITGKAVEKLCALTSDPKHVRAAIGPGIGKCCFETGAEVPEAVRKVLGSDDAEACITGKSAGKSMVDLKETNRRLLIRAGVSPDHIRVSGYCTMCNPDLFWSHRVTEGKRGVQAAIIRRGEVL